MLKKAKRALKGIDARPFEVATADGIMVQRTWHLDNAKCVRDHYNQHGDQNRRPYKIVDRRKVKP